VGSENNKYGCSLFIKHFKESVEMYQWVWEVGGSDCIARECGKYVGVFGVGRRLGCVGSVD